MEPKPEPSVDEEGYESTDEGAVEDAQVEADEDRSVLVVKPEASVVVVVWAPVERFTISLRRFFAEKQDEGRA